MSRLHYRQTPSCSIDSSFLLPVCPQIAAWRTPPSHEDKKLYGCPFHPPMGHNKGARVVEISYNPRPSLDGTQNLSYFWSRTQRCQETGWLAADMRWLDPWYKESLRHPVLERIKLNSFNPSNTSPGSCSNLPVLFVHPG